MATSVHQAIRVQALTKHYGSVAAVEDVAIEASVGEIIGVLGRNGAGKTTALECVLGLREPDAGDIAILGLDVRREPVRTRRTIGAMLQGAALQDKITAREALRYFGGFYDGAMPSDEAVEKFALGEFADRRFLTLSAGQRQRLLLALAFVHRPKVVVLDEPTVGLDPLSRREFHSLLGAARAEGTAILMSTHDLEEAERLCDRVAVMETGRIVATGSPAELLARVASPPQLRLRTRRPVAPTELGALAGVRSCEWRAEAWRVGCTDVNQALVSLAHFVAATNNELLELTLVQPTLEEAFFRLTGTRWESEARDA